MTRPSPSSCPRLLVKSRELMQSVSAKSKYIDEFKNTEGRCIVARSRLMEEIMTGIWNDIQETIFGSGETKYTYNISKHFPKLTDTESFAHRVSIYCLCFKNGTFEDSFRIELLDIFKKEYPGCTIEYYEEKNDDGSVGYSDITIDWTKNE
jgi:hypothetical protein